MNISSIRGVIRVSCSSCASVARLRPSAGYATSSLAAIMKAFHDCVGLIRRLHIYTNIFPNRAASFFSAPFSCSSNEWLLFRLQIPFVYLFCRIRTAQYRTTISPLLADWMAILPTMNVCWGIRLPRKDCSGQRTSPNENSFGKRFMLGMKSTVEYYPIKCHKIMSE